MFFEVFNDLQDIVVYIERIRAINQHLGITGKLIQAKLYTGLIKKRNFFRQLERNNFLVLCRLLSVEKSVLLILSENKEDRECHPDTYSF